MSTSGTPEEVGPVACDTCPSGQMRRTIDDEYVTYKCQRCTRVLRYRRENKTPPPAHLHNPK